jgi:hypothetical protein
MNKKSIVQSLGAFVFFLGIVGFFMGEGLLSGIMNIDLLLDITRISLGIMLFASSFTTDKYIQIAFMLFGLVYIAHFIIAFLSPTMFGLLPSEYGVIDNVFHITGGLLSLGIAYIGDSRINVRRKLFSS